MGLGLVRTVRVMVSVEMIAVRVCVGGGETEDFVVEVPAS